MWSWMTRWLGYGGGDVPATTATGPPAVKAPRGATLTTFVRGGVGSVTPKWNDTDTAKFNSGWVHAAVRVIAQRIAGQGVRVGRRRTTRPTKAVKSASDGPPWMSPGAVKELDSHGLLDAFDDPTPYHTGWSVLYLIVSSLQLTGVAYLWIDEQPDGTTRLWVLPAGWVWPDPEADPLTRYIIRPGRGVAEFTLDASELIRFALDDPSDPFGALGPLRAAVMSVLTDREIQTAQVAKFRNGARPGLVVKVNQQAESGGLPGAKPTLTSAQRRALEVRFSQAYAGSEADGLPLLLDGFIEDVKPLFDGTQELDFAGSTDSVKERILLGFGVNGIVIGQVEGANRASSTVADEHFCYSTCRPLCVLIGQTLTKWFRVHHDDPDLVVWVPPPEPRDPDGRRADLDQLSRSGAITVNELRAEHGLPPLPGDAGNALVKAPSPAPPTVPSGDKPDADKSSGLILPGDPGWAKGADLWPMLTPSQQLDVYKRARSGSAKRVIVD